MGSFALTGVRHFPSRGERMSLLRSLAVPAASVAIDMALLAELCGFPQRAPAFRAMRISYSPRTGTLGGQREAAPAWRIEVQN